MSSSSSSQVKQEAQAPQFTCPTCLGDFPPDSKQVVQVSQDLGCRHSMCVACYDKLDRDNPKCPVCRHPIVLPPLPVPAYGAVNNPTPRMIEAASFFRLEGQNGSASRFNVALVRTDGVSCRTVVTPSMAQTLREAFMAPPFNQPDPGLEFFMLPTNGNIFSACRAPDVEAPFAVEMNQLDNQSIHLDMLCNNKTVACQPGPDGKLVPCAVQPSLRAYDGFALLHALADDLAASRAKQAEIQWAAQQLVEAATRCDELEGTGSTDSTRRSATIHLSRVTHNLNALTTMEEQKQVFCRFDEKTDQWTPIKSTVPGQRYADSQEVATALLFSPQLACRFAALRHVDRLLSEHMNFIHPRESASCYISGDIIRAFLGGWQDFDAGDRRPENVKTKLSMALRAHLQLAYHQAHGGNGPLLRERSPMPPALKALLDAKKDKKRKGADFIDPVKRECPSPPPPPPPSLDD